MKNETASGNCERVEVVEGRPGRTVSSRGEQRPEKACFFRCERREHACEWLAPTGCCRAYRDVFTACPARPFLYYFDSLKHLFSTRHWLRLVIQDNQFPQQAGGVGAGGQVEMQDLVTALLFQLQVTGQQAQGAGLSAEAGFAQVITDVRRRAARVIGAPQPGCRVDVALFQALLQGGIPGVRMEETVTTVQQDRISWLPGQPVAIGDAPAQFAIEQPGPQGGQHAAAQFPLQGQFVLFHPGRSEEHTSELQSQSNLVCRLLLEK